MTLSNPSAGHAPALPNGRRVDLKDLTPEARDLLRGLSLSNIRSLAIQAGCDLNYSDEASYTSDPALAAKEALALLGRKAEYDLDDGTQEALDRLRIAVLVLRQEDDLDGVDCRALAWLLNRAENLLEQEHRFNGEARRRLYVGTGGRPL